MKPQQSSGLRNLKINSKKPERQTYQTKRNRKVRWGGGGGMKKRENRLNEPEVSPREADPTNEEKNRKERCGGMVGGGG